MKSLKQRWAKFIIKCFRPCEDTIIISACIQERSLNDTVLEFKIWFWKYITESMFREESQLFIVNNWARIVENESKIQFEKY